MENKSVSVVKIYLLAIAFVVLVLLTLSIVSATVDMKITASLNNKKSMLLVKSDPKCTAGYDGRDSKVATIPGNSYSLLYSDLNGNGVTKLSVDCWSESTRMRVINLVYYLTDNFVRVSDLSWNIHKSVYRPKLMDYGNDSNYHNLVGGPIDMDSLSDYNVANSMGSRYFQISFNSFILPNVTKFPGSNTTNFEIQPDLNNVTNLTLENSHGIIKVKQKGVNAEAQDYDDNVQLGDKFLVVNASGLNQTFNTTTVITLYNVSCYYPIYYTNNFYNSSKDIIAEGHICNGTTNPSCTNVQCANNISTFTVAHFTGYAIGANSNLVIFDQSDSLGGSITSYSGNQIKFYSNYTDLTDGAIMGATCNVCFNDTGSCSGMFYNSTSKMYEFNRIFSAGAYIWNSTCNKTGYDTIQTNDNLLINSGVVGATNLVIWDNNDAIGGSQTITAPSGSANFYVNYTNSSSSPINATCKIKFKIVSSSWTPEFNMNYNAGTKLYEYTTQFASGGTYIWNVTCNDTSGTYPIIQATDTINISPAPVTSTPSSGGSGGPSVGGVSSGNVNASLDEIVSITLPISVVNFGNVTQNHTYVSLSGIQIQNDGTVRVNLDINGTELFNGSTRKSTDYMFRMAGATEGDWNSGVFDIKSIIDWTPMTGIVRTALFNLDFNDAKDIAAMQINVTVPSDEPSGAKESIITITASQA